MTHEAADIMNVMLGVLSANYPELSSAEISDKLLQSFIAKGKKYADCISKRK